MLQYTEEQNKSASVWRGWMSHSPGGRQVHPDQTMAVKGKNGKTLATAGSIKRVLPCPVAGIEKQSISSGVKEKIEQEENKKDKKENRKDKKGKLRKRRVGSIGHAFIDRFPSLPLQILPSSKT